MVIMQILVFILSALILLYVLLVSLVGIFNSVLLIDYYIRFTNNKKSLIGLTNKKWFITTIRICSFIGLLFSILIIYCFFKKN